jgi:regulator of replication initiation timing
LKDSESLRHQVEVFRRRSKRFWKENRQLRAENRELRKMLKEDRQHELALRVKASEGRKVELPPDGPTPLWASRETPGVL